MDTNDILEAIDRQITQLKQARAVLAGVAADAPAIATTKQSAGMRRGRPKGSVNKKPEVVVTVAKKVARRTMSAEGKARIAATQKARWAAQKKTSVAAKSSAKKAAKKASKATKKDVAMKRVAAAKSATAPAKEA